MTAIDHAFFIVFALVHPIAGYVSFRRLMKRIDAGEHVDRANLYSFATIVQWFLFVMAIAIWFATGRPWAALGFGLATDAYFVLGAALTVTGIVLLLLQLRQVAASDVNELRKFRGQLGRLEVIIPRNGNELGRFYGLSVTAGVVEETLWRGFMIWYLSQVMPLWAAAVLSAIGFGVAHAYQGAGHLPRVTLVSAAFVGLYLLTGSVWLPMILHAAVDILQGRTGYEIMRRTEAADAPADEATPVQA